MRRAIAAVVVTSLALLVFGGGLSNKSTIVSAYWSPTYHCGSVCCASFSCHRRRRVHPATTRTNHALAPALTFFASRRGANHHQQQRQQDRYKATTSSSLSDQTDDDDDDDEEEEEEVVKGITLKIAVDAQGAVADLAADKSERFTCAESLDMVHRLRAVSDAVLVGKTTVLVDNPSLTVRRCPLPIKKKKQPIRVVLDPTLSLLRNETIRTTFHLFRPDENADGKASTPKMILFYANDIDVDAGMEQILANLPDHVSCLALPRASEDGRLLSITSLLDTLSRCFHVEHIMIEGGPVTAKQFLPFADRCLLVRAVAVRFKEPLDAGLSTSTLEDAGLQYLGTTKSGADEIDYWSRRRRRRHHPGNSSKDASWPTADLSDWP